VFEEGDFETLAGDYLLEEMGDLLYYVFADLLRTKLLYSHAQKVTMAF